MCSHDTITALQKSIPMTKTCIITGKSLNRAGGYSNRTRATQFNPTGTRRQKANIQSRKFYVPEINKTIRIDVSAQGLRVIQKKGAYRALKDAKVI